MTSDTEHPQPTDQHRLAIREERRVAAPYRGMFATRIVIEFVVGAVSWIAVLALGISGAIPLWAGLILNTILATTFYMPLHEATHGNIWGGHRRARWGEDLIGVLSSIPLGIDYFAHRLEHMRHHAYTNDPARDPDFYAQGPLKAVPIAWWATALGQTLLPLFVFVPASRRLLPGRFADRAGLSGDADTLDAAKLKAGKAHLRYWIAAAVVLTVSFVAGIGWEAVLLWYLPARLSIFWLILVFAWFPHHPADQVGRYVDTRVAVFPGSTFLIRGHDHHALHHLFPRVPHYLLPSLWQEMGPQLTPRGVRTEGRALGATGPVVW